jgi:hypothetical protein
MIDEPERFDDPDGTLYRLAFMMRNGTANILYIERRLARVLFEHLRTEFEDETADDETTRPPDPDDETYVLTPRGIAITDGLRLVSSVIKTTTYGDSIDPTVEVTETYE